MSGWRRFWIGGGGALLPLIVTLLAVDISGLIDHRGDYTVGTYVGAGLRYFILFGLGGVVAALNSDEHNPIKLVQLGIAAPALIASYVNAQAASAPRPSPAPPTPVHAPGPSGFLNLITPANAAEVSGESRVPKVITVEFLNDVFRGLSRPLPAIEQRPVEKTEQPSSISREEADALHRAIERATQSAIETNDAASKAEAAAKRAAEEQSPEAIHAAQTYSTEAAMAAANSKAKLEALKTTSEKLK